MPWESDEQLKARIRRRNKKRPLTDVEKGFKEDKKRMRSKYRYKTKDKQEEFKDPPTIQKILGLKPKEVKED